MIVEPVQPVVARPVRQLAAVPAWRWWVAGSFLARLPVTMVVIALVLAGRQLGSYGLGAGLAGLHMGSAGAGALWRGRALDRRELRRGIVGELIVMAAALAAAATLVQIRAPLALLILAVLASGVASSAVMAGYRSFLREVVSPDLLRPALALDAVLVEVGFVTGPAVAGGVALLIGPVGVLWTMAACALVAAWAAGTRLPERHPPPAEAVATPPPWSDRFVLANYGVTFAVGISIGLLEAGFAPLAEVLGAAGGVAGVCSAAYALGSGVGGLAFATRLTNRSDHGRRALVLAAALGLLLLPVAAAPSLPVLLGLLFLGGLPFATANAAASSHLQARVHPSRVTEGFALTTTAVLLGVGAGSGLASLLLAAESSPRLLYVLAAVPPVVAVAAATVWSTTGGEGRRSTSRNGAGANLGERMFVLGIDPGVTRCGYGCVHEPPGGPATAVAAGVLATPSADPLPARLASLSADLAALLADLAPDVVVVERVLFSANARTAMATGQASGLALALAHGAGCAVATYSPNEVKLAVAGHGGADKRQVQRMVATLLGLAAAPKPADAADALALALTHLALARVPALAATRERR